MSMFEPRATHKPFPIPTPKELMAGLPGRLPTIKDDKVGSIVVFYSQIYSTEIPDLLYRPI